MTVTGTVKTMQEQNRIFAEKEPNHFKRVHRMAADIKQRIDEEFERDNNRRTKRHGTEERIAIWQHNR